MNALNRFAIGLYALAGYTLVTKFLMPVVYALGNREPLGRYVMWDFWWVAHLGLGFGLARRRAWAWSAGLAVALLEIGIVATKYALFLRAPDWDFWHTSWFVNKLFVLGLFALLLIHLLQRGVRAQFGAAS